MPYPLLACALVATYFSIVIVVLYAILRGDVNLVGVLQGDGTQVLLERQVSLVTTVVGAFAYLYLGLSNATASNGASLPTVPAGVVELVAGGNIAYLAGKVFRATR